MAHQSVSGSSTHSLLLSNPWYVNFIDKLNTIWHERALQLFMVIVLGHWAEHLAQAYQIYVMGWPVPQSLGVLGYWLPWLVKSETLHYSYALVMLIGLWVLRTGFTGTAYTWWMISFWIQFWHHIEHFLLQMQALVGYNLGDSPVPISLVQFIIPRVELHLIYNTLVFIPMIIGMYFHMFPPPGEEGDIKCTCVVHRKTSSK